MFEIYLLHSNFEFNFAHEHCSRDSAGIVEPVVHHLLHDHVGLHGDHPLLPQVDHHSRLFFKFSASAYLGISASYVPSLIYDCQLQIYLFLNLREIE